jgi:hypothetical protein
MQNDLIIDKDKDAVEKIRVYQLYSIDKLVQLKLPIQYTIFEPYGIKIDNEQTFFSISPTSGWMNFSDHSQLWQSKNSNLLDWNSANVINVAEAFINDNNEKVDNFNLRHNSDLPSLFPNKNERKLTNCFAVKHRDGNWIDHWLCVFETYVSGFLNRGSKALVYGTALELRIGVENRVIAFSSRWRSYTNTIDTNLLAFSSLHSTLEQHNDSGNKKNGHEEHNLSSHKDRKNIIYVLDGDGNEQYHLTPFYYETNGHHLIFTPASKFSLSISIFQQDLEKETQLIALVEGGSGDYAYRWAYWNFDSIVKNEKIIELGKGKTEKKRIESKEVTINTINIPTGFYNIMLDVVDSRTKAFKHIQQLIFSQPI